ncbi:hypothetical protein ACQ4PT_027064 [Festuca glaucescens]
MFTRGGSGRSSSNASGSNRSASLREIDEEATILEDEADDGGGGELYVAVGKDVKDGRSNLLWAARNLLAGDLKLVLLLHVHQPAERIMTGLCKVSASQLEKKELKAYRKIEKEDMNTLLNQYVNFCRVSLKMQAETLVVEKNSPATGIIELIDQNHIAKLVMGTSSVSMEATHLSAKVESPRSSCVSSVSDQPEFPPRSLSLPPGNPDSVENMPAARRRSIDLTAIGFSPNSSQQRSGGSSSGLKDLDSMDGSPVPVSVASSEEYQHSMGQENYSPNI